MITIKTKGSTKRRDRYFSESLKINNKFLAIMHKYGPKGVEALRNATPIRTGYTANSWDYSVENWGLSFSNSNVVNGVNIAILLQYGHGTRNGGYVEGIDYINPALKPIFDAISKEIESEVRNL